MKTIRTFLTFLAVMAAVFLPGFAPSSRAAEIQIVGFNVEIPDGDTTPRTEDFTFFGVQTVGAGNITKSFKIRNTSGTAGDNLSLSGTPRVVIGGANPGDFVVTMQPAASVGPNDSTTFEVTWTPTFGGIHNATLSIANNDSNENPFNFAIQATAQLRLAYTAGANGSLTGTTTQTVNIGASGTAVTAVPATGYRFVNWSDSSTQISRTDLNVTQNVTVTANFALRTAEIQILGNNFEILDGDSTPRTEDFTFFGVQTVGAGSIAKSFTIRNTSVTANDNLSLSGTPRVVIGGANPGDFVVTTQPAASVAPAGSTTFIVTWTPAAGGIRDATLSIANTDSDENPYNFAIQATAILTLNYFAGPNGTLTGDVVQGGFEARTAVTAVPNDGYRFVNWSDGSTENPRIDLNVTQNVNVTANFAIKTYTVTYTAGANGSINGLISYTQIINHGASSLAFAAIPSSGYSFVNWSDGSTENPRGELNVTQNVNVTANFVLNTYTLTYAAGANGSLTGTTPQTVNHGASGTALTAVPATGYRFVNWSDGSTANPRTDANVTASLSVTANFLLPFLVTTAANSGPGSLRQAIATAEAEAGPNTILFAPGLTGPITLSGEIAITTEVTLDAASLPGGMTITANGASRLFSVGSSGNLTLRSLTLTGGNAGGGVSFGGAINNGGTITLTHCTLSGNSAEYGGAIINGGTATLTHCTLAGNVGAYGGAIYNGGSLALTHCTVSGNIGRYPWGTGIYKDSSGTLTLTNSIVAGNSGYLVDGYNIEGAFTQIGVNLTSGDPKLAPLGNYGGPTQTMPPLPGSPALDAATVLSPAITSDQRGFPLQDGDGNGSVIADIGAAEAQPVIVTTLADAGPGSLRAALAADASGTTPAAIVAFAPALAGQSVALDNSLTITNAALDTSTSTAPVDVTVNVGTLRFEGGSAWTGGGKIFLGDATGSAAATLEVAGPAGFILAAPITVRAGTQTVTGGQLSGALLVNGGTLNFRAIQTAAAATTVASGATLTGSGSVNNLTLQSGSFFAPDTTTPPGTIGTLTTTGTTTVWQGGATARLHLSNSDQTSDKLAVTGTLSAAGSAPFTFDFQGTGGGGRTYTLATFASRTGFSPASFAYTGLASGLDGSFTLQADKLTFTTRFLVTTAANSGPGSLRQAVADAAAAAGPDTIYFAPGLTGPIALSGEISITTEVTLDASSLPGGMTITANGPSRLFFVGSSGNLTLRSLTLTGGNSGGDFGGAIANGGTVTLTHCTLSGNSATFGGAINNGGTMTLTHCTLTSNSATYGAAIHCTAGTLALTHCTVSGHYGASFQTGIYRNAGTLRLTNTIVAGYSSYNIYGGFTPVGVNLIDGDPKLAPLGYYGGPTQTMPLLPGSPARDAATVLSPAITSDQRGFPIVGLPDIGAYEAGTFSSFAIWARESSGGALTFGTDNDQDGASDGLEYATRRDPKASDAALSPKLAPAVPSGRTFEFRYQKNAKDLRYIVQRSSTLSSWTEIYRFDTSTGIITETGVTANENTGTEIITLTDPVPGPAHFWRLLVEEIE